MTDVQLSAKPKSGNVESVIVLPGDQQAIVQGRLKRNDDELFLVDFATPGPVRRISQYIPDTDTGRDVGKFALWPDATGLVFLQAADAANTNQRPFSVTFADVPAAETDGPAAVAFGFGDLTGSFTVASESINDVVFAGDALAGFVGDARGVNQFEVYTVDRATGETRAVAPIQGPALTGPTFSEDRAFLAVRANASGAVSFVAL